MSEANLELVRRSFEAFSRGDFETAFAAHDPEIEWRTASDEPDRETFRGPDGMKRFLASISDLWEDRFADQMEFEPLIDRGDWVVVPWTMRVRGKASGIPMDVKETYAVLVRDGRIVRVEEYRSTEEALRAVPGP